MKTQTVLQSIVNRINDTLIAQGKNQVIELTVEGRKVYLQLVTRAIKDVSKVYLTTCGLTPARTFDWLITFEIAININ